MDGEAEGRGQGMGECVRYSNLRYNDMDRMQIGMRGPGVTAEQGRQGDVDFLRCVAVKHILAR